MIALQHKNPRTKPLLITLMENIIQNGGQTRCLASSMDTIRIASVD